MTISPSTEANFNQQHIHKGSFTKRKRDYEVYSMQVLEKLLALGIVPNVVVPRPLAECDVWWLKLVPMNKVFFDSGEGSLSQRQMRALKKLFAHNNIPWPENESAQIQSKRRSQRQELPTPRFTSARAKHLWPALRLLPQYGFLSWEEIVAITR